MSIAEERFRQWLEDPYFAPCHQELKAIAGDSEEIEDRFYRFLHFGTGGLRGVIAAGTNRMNVYVVRYATQGLADYIRTFGPDSMARGVVIAHDSRRMSREFALEAALTLAASGIPAYLFDSLRPTPLLSYAVRELGAIAGIVITASHNPPQYNGYKVYWEDGGQIPPQRASQVETAMAAIQDMTSIHPMAEAEARARGLLREVPSAVDRSYRKRLLSLVTTPLAARQSCRILYTPLHGTGRIPVRSVLSEAGYPVKLVPEQEMPDPEFSTVEYPNPEEPAVFRLALKHAETEHPDLILATDPDADRLGVMVRDQQGRYQLLTGNQVGAILVDYLLTSRFAAGTLPKNAAVIKTIATSNMIAPLCRQYGVTLMDVHTGFKFIGDRIHQFEETGSHTFLLGYEESCGYLGAAFVRDKDGVMAALLVAEAAAYQKARGRTLLDELESIWQRCGYFCEALHNVTLPGAEGQVRIAQLMAALRNQPPTAFGGIPVAFTDDYTTGMGIENATGRRYPLNLEKADVLHYRFADGGFVMARPSGTEPKLKLYFSVRGGSRAEAEQRLQAVRADLLQRLGLV